MKKPWSQENWGVSVSVKAYNPGWWPYLTPDKEPELWEELRAIYELEQSLPVVPGWASEIVVRMMELPMCGYYGYPDNVYQIVDAIAVEQCPEIVKRCYTVDSGRKVLLSYYVYCLDAWWKGAPLSHVTAELSLRESLRKDWEAIAAAIYETLGESTQLKVVVVERLIHRLRWWIKTLIWPGDRRDRFMLDVYSGDIRGDEKNWSAYGNSPFGDPYFVELGLPQVKEMEAQIIAGIPEGEKLLERIHSTWLCAPKVFRYLEKLIVEIGSIDSESLPDFDVNILQCEDTYPDFAANHRHFTGFVGRLHLWLEGNDDTFPEFGRRTLEKEWLVHLLRHKLLFHARYEENFARLVGERDHGKSGSKKPV